MTKTELLNSIENASRRTISEDELENLFRDVNCNGKIYSVYLCGTDEMFDNNEFYQIGIDADGKQYEFFFDVSNCALEDADYSHAYRVEELDPDFYF